MNSVIVGENVPVSERQANPMVSTKENKEVFKKCLTFWHEKSLDATVLN